MKYVLTAQDYQYWNSNESLQLRNLVESIPTKFWESLDSIQLTFQEATSETQSYQQVLLESFDEIEEINDSQRALFFAGIVEAGLISAESYKNAVNEAFAVYEGLWDTVKSFLSAITEGGSAIGILHLILDIIGLVPGSWVGFPIDVVANILNALIYGARGMWFLAIISAIAAIPANYVFKGLKLSLTPFAKILDKLGIAIFKADTAAVKIASAELKAAAGVDKAASLSGALQGFIGFIKGSLVTILKAVGALLGKVVSIATFGMVKGERIVKFIEANIEVPLMKAVKGSEEAVIALKEGDAALATATRTDVAAAARGLAADEVDLLVSKFKKLGVGDGDLVAKATNSRAFKEMVEAGAPKAAQEAYVNAAVARMAFDDAIKATDKILANPQATRILQRAGWRADSNLVKKAINAGDDASLEIIFKEMTENPAILKTLTEGEANVLRVYSKYPKDFIKHGRHFDDYLTTLTKIGTRFAYRERIGRRLLIFFLKQTAKAIMQHECYKEWTKAISDVNSADELKTLAATKVINEAIDKRRDEVRAQICKEYGIKQEDLNESGKAELEALVDSALGKADQAKSDCGLGSEATNAVTGANMYNPGLYGDDNMFGEKDLTEEDYDKLMQTQKTMLKSLGMDPDIDPQHDMTNADPIVKLYFSDVYDPKGKVLNINVKDESRLEKTGSYLLERGQIRSAEELNDYMEKIKKSWDSGEELPEVTKALSAAEDSTKINESGDINKQSQFMTFEQFKNAKK
jgi:hypothetical protein